MEYTMRRCRSVSHASFRVYKSTFTNMFFALSKEKKPKTSMKLVCNAEDKIIGAHVIGMGADEMMQVSCRLRCRGLDFLINGICRALALL